MLPISHATQIAQARSPGVISPKDVYSLSWSLPKYRLETSYRNAVQTAYQAGHWRSFEETAGALPCLMYDTINDSRVCPTQLALDGVIKPVGDAYWKTRSPPLGHRCRCTLKAISRADVMRRGGVTQNPPAEGGPDSGWGADPREWGRTLERLVRERLSVCHTVGLSAGNGKSGAPYVGCLPDVHRHITSLDPIPTVPTLRDMDFFGQRPGLTELAPVSVVALTGEEFGVRLRYLQLAKAADQHLRKLQQESGLFNEDTG